MSLDTTVPRSRRALLAAAAGAAAATVVAAVERPLPVVAATGDIVHQGDTLYGTTPTSFITLSGYALEAITNGTDTAFLGQSLSGTGVLGVTSTGYGVDGAAGESGVGVHGASDSGNGVEGWSNSGIGVSADGGTAGVGVHGWTPAGTGVIGSTDSGTGVRATATTGTALQVAGKAKFSRSGRATVLKGKSYVDITVTGGLTSRSMVHATLQTYRSGVSIAAVRINYPTRARPGST